MKKILLLGASGSIGKQTLDIIRNNPNEFLLVGVSVGKNIEALKELLNEFKSIKYVYAIDPVEIAKLTKIYPDINFYFGEYGLSHITLDCDFDMMVNALVGFSGLVPTINALNKDKIVALANKESLVVGGQLINDILKTKGKLYPIDSEHAALLKCINKVNKDEITKLIITASGGAFRNLSHEQLNNVTKTDALNHPTWKMGKKITIDCATMMNKGFEVIEAFYLFNFPLDKIEVLLHDESMIHSMIKLQDNTYVADISKPDMHNPIKYALYETNIDYEVFRDSDYHNFGNYHFKEFDGDRYPCVEFAIRALKCGGLMPCVLNASNEIAVNAFLNDEIKFIDIEKIIIKSMINFKNNIKNPSLEEILNCDELTRVLTKEMIERRDY